MTSLMNDSGSAGDLSEMPEKMALSCMGWICRSRVVYFNCLLSLVTASICLLSDLTEVSISWFDFCSYDVIMGKFQAAADVFHFLVQ